MEVSVRLSCKKYVAHWLRMKYGERPYLTRGTSEGLFFMSLLERGMARYDKRITPYEEAIEVKISYVDCECYGAAMTLTAANSFNKMIEEKLKDEFMIHMDTLVDIAGYQQHAAIRLFQNKYGFSDEVWPFCALKKHYQRQKSPTNTLKAA